MDLSTLQRRRYKFYYPLAISLRVRCGRILVPQDLRFQISILPVALNLKIRRPAQRKIIKKQNYVILS